MSKSQIAWLTLLGLALATRLVALNGAPLNPAEARLALQSFAAVQHGEWAAFTISPLLLTGNALLFLFCGAGDGIARLLPALGGVVFVALPFLWMQFRAARRLNAHAALLAGALLLCSPVALFAARQVNGAMLGATGAILAVTALMFAGEGAAQLAAIVGAAGLALGLTGGAAFYDVLLPGVIAWALYRWMELEPRPLERRALLQALGAGLAGAALISIALGWRWNGWGGPGEGLLAWFTGWRTTDAPGANVGLLGVYEPLTLLLAVVGLGGILGKSLLKQELKDEDLLPIMFGIWALLACLLVMLRRSAEPVAILAALFPLALLAGWNAERLWRNIRAWAWEGERLHALLTIAFWVFAAMALARHTTNSQVRNDLELTLFALIILIQVLLVAGFAAFSDQRASWRAFLLGSAAILFTFQVGFALNLAFVRANNPAEPLIVSGASPDLRRLRVFVDALMVQRNESPETFNVALVTGDADNAAVVAWTLRDLPAFGVSAGWPAAATDLIITDTTYTVGQNTAERQGMAFTAVMRSGGPTPGCENILPPVCEYPLKWYLYRATPIAPAQSRVVLWAIW